MRWWLPFLGCLLASRLCAGCRSIESGPRHWALLCEGYGWWRVDKLLTTRGVYGSCPAKTAVDPGDFKGEGIRTWGCYLTHNEGFKSQKGSQMQCMAESSPFQSGVINVKQVSITMITDNCELEARIDGPSKHRLVTFICGLLLLLAARTMSESSHVRIALGTLVIVLIGVFIFFFFIFPRLTRVGIGGIALLGAFLFMAMGANVIAWATFGKTFGPLSIHWNYYVYGYFLTVGILGWIFCYLHDNPHDVRRKKLLAILVKMSGLGLVFFSSSDRIGGGILVISLILLDLILNSRTMGTWGMVRICSSIMGLLARDKQGLQRAVSKYDARIVQRKKNNDIMDEVSDEEYSDDDWEGDETPKAMKKWAPICQKGYIWDSCSNQLIELGGFPYQRLLDSGREPDFREGHI